MSHPNKILSQYYPFKALSNDEFDFISTAIITRAVNRGSLHLSQGDSMPYLLVTLEGLCHAYNLKSNHTIATLEIILPGRILFPVGISGDKYTSPYYLRSCIDSQFAIIPLRILDKSYAQGAFCNALIKSLLFNLERQRNIASICTFTNPFDRVCAFFKNYMIGRDSEFSLPFLPPQKVISECTATSRESVSRAINELLRINVLSRSANGLTVLTPSFFDRF